MPLHCLYECHYLALIVWTTQPHRWDLFLSYRLPPKITTIICFTIRHLRNEKGTSQPKSSPQLSLGSLLRSHRSVIGGLFFPGRPCNSPRRLCESHSVHLLHDLLRGHNHIVQTTFSSLNFRKPTRTIIKWHGIGGVVTPLSERFIMN